MRVARGGNNADRLVNRDIATSIARLRYLDQPPVDGDRVAVRIDTCAKLANHATVYGDAALHDHVFGGPQRGHSGPCQYFVQSFKHMEAERVPRC